MAIDIARMKQRLEAKRVELERNMAGLTEAHPELEGSIALDEGPRDLEDRSVDVQQTQQEKEILDNEQDLLDQVNAALQRIEQGTYGICENCGQPIYEKRLEALPWASLCLKCQVEQSHS
ncbi:MAG: TraR/DksA family transcriptional regulator [Ktedonobacteraceae bacterium]